MLSITREVIFPASMQRVKRCVLSAALIWRSAARRHPAKCISHSIKHGHTCRGMIQVPAHPFNVAVLLHQVDSISLSHGMSPNINRHSKSAGNTLQVFPDGLSRARLFGIKRARKSPLRFPGGAAYFIGQPVRKPHVFPLPCLLLSHPERATKLIFFHRQYIPNT